MSLDPFPFEGGVWERDYGPARFALVRDVSIIIAFRDRANNSLHARSPDPSFQFLVLRGVARETMVCFSYTLKRKFYQRVTLEPLDGKTSF